MDPSRLGRLPPPFSFQPMQTLQQQQQLEQQQQQQAGMHHHHHSSNNSEEDEYSNSSGHNVGNNNNSSGKGGGATGKKHLGGSPGSKSGGSMGEGEVVRKPRGRPPGSKNKPKPPIIITRETGTGMRPHVLEIASGCDVHECIASFARRRQRALCVLGASGTVSNVSLRQPGAPPSASVVTLHGRFDILSLSGTFMAAPQLLPMPIQGAPPGSTAPLFGGATSGNNGTQQQQQQQHQQQMQSSASNSASSSGLTISMAGTQGQVIGGCVVGALVSVSPVLVIAASFLGPCFDRLPLEEHEAEHGLNGNGGHHGGGGGGGGGHHLALGAGGGGGGGLGIGGGGVQNDPCAMALYNLPQASLGNCQITPDILAWAAAGGRPPF